MSAPMVRNKT